MEDIICDLCGRRYCYRRADRATKETCGSCMTNKHRFALKAISVIYKGGGCQLCGYSKCNRALSFHHLNPSEKSFDFGSRHNVAWEKIKEELAKCVCLCKNCHEEVEDALEWNKNNPILVRLQEVAAAWKPSSVPNPRAEWMKYHPALLNKIVNTT